MEAMWGPEGMSPDGPGEGKHRDPLSRPFPGSPGMPGGAATFCLQPWVS